MIPYLHELAGEAQRTGLTAREVYLPEGRWRDYWTGAILDGPRRILAAAPTHRIPVFLRVGSEPALPAPDSLGLPPVSS